ncbi:tRNA pseudouridine(55) synthase TruB [uncultured Hyphomicrobium sp.]|uniref:tRNA pseudouridine(55) synthase TruB n=1 Tax=uncultured Hyphomicrobium sp. TaxID=194373 RepID=UPI0025EF026E|nr:tRNA pseudouridine(55) synthase TruB [uncultured Hyphomicrobium sp.]
MARRKKGNPVHGWLVLDKPLEMTSTRAVGILKRLYFAQKVGHAGTLDPLATGILPIAFGEATKTVSFAVDGEKVYRFTVRWGAETVTDDAEGNVIATGNSRPTVGDIEALLPQFTGEIMQVPPQFSAIKVDGERAYALARDGEEVVLEARPVVIDELRLVDVPDGNTAVFEARCGKGTYVRAIARDMGRALGCRGHVIGLRRTRVGPFAEDESVGLDEIEDAAEAGEDLTSFLQPVEMALGNILEVNVSPSDAADLAQGRSILIRGRDAPILGGAAYAMSKGRIIALGEIEKGALHPTRVFNFGG